MEVMGLDRGHCGLGETEHPFTLEFNNKDVRKHLLLLDRIFQMQEAVIDLGLLADGRCV